MYLILVLLVFLLFGLCLLGAQQRQLHNTPPNVCGITQRFRGEHTLTVDFCPESGYTTLIVIVNRRGGTEMEKNKTVEELLDTILEIAHGNENHVSRTMVQDLLKESRISEEPGLMEQVLLRLEKSGITIDPTESDESYADFSEPDPNMRFVPADVNIRPRSMSVDQLIARLRYNEIDLHPGYQRSRDLWDDVTQSRLIESLLLKIPLPAFYFDARNDDKWAVIDGLQRLTAFEKFFVKETLSLSGMEYLSELNGTSYKKLPRQYMRRLLESGITVYTVEKGTPEELVYNIFKRINTAGLGLEPQEIRHALYQGNSTRLADTLAESKEFRIATGGAVSSRRMLDREYIIRYYAFTQLDFSVEYKENIDQFLIQAMKKVNTYDECQLKMTEQRFYMIMEVCHDIFGKYTFRRILQNGRRGMVNKAIFELWCACLYNMLPENKSLILQHKEDIFSEFQELLNEQPFSGWINNGDKPSMINRIQAAKEMLRNVLT